MLNPRGRYQNTFTDADIPFRIFIYDLIIKSILTQDYDVVIGDRTLEESVYFTENLLKRKWEVISILFS